MKVSKASFAAGALTALILGSGTAYAATGGSFILGTSNSAGATTSLSNSNGTALSLSSKSGTAPLKVNRTTKVANLNADRLDGIDGSSFARSSMQAGAFNEFATGEDWDDDGIDDNYVAYATCPQGSQLTGGGVNDFTASGVTWFNGPIGQNTWEVDVFIDGTIDNDPTSVVGSAVCLNPKGAISGALRVAPSDLAAQHAQRVEKAKARLGK